MFLNKRFSIYKNKKCLLLVTTVSLGRGLQHLLKLKSKVFGISLKNQNKAYRFIVNKKILT